MSIGTIFLAAIVAFDIAILIKVYQSHGDMRYAKGRLDGFVECENLMNVELLKAKKKLDKKYDKKTKTESEMLRPVRKSN